MRSKPGRADALRAALLALVSPTRAEVACLAYDVYEEADGSLVLVESWRSTEELRVRQEMPAVLELFGEQLPDLLTEDMGVHYSAPLEPAA